jgi:hypothetical protein
MDLLQNPFHILGVTPRDNRQKVMDLCEERSLLRDPAECSQCRLDLTNPRKRLSMEIAWLPGLGPKRVKDVIYALEHSVSDLQSMDRLPPITRANLLAAGLSRLRSDALDEVAEWIVSFSWAFEMIDPGVVTTLVNEDRIVSGFPEVTDLSAVEAEIQERRRYYRQIIKSALDNLDTKQLVQEITIIVEAATDNGERQAPILIDDLIDSYEVEAQPFLEKETRNIEVLVEKLKTAADAKQLDPILASIVSNLVQVVRNWDTVAQPIQLSRKSRGLDHDASKHVAWIVRDAAIHLFNEHGKLDISKHLTSLLQEALAEVGEVAELIAEDANSLDELAKQRAERIKDEMKRAEEWRREITYEAKVGVAVKKKLRISPEGIEWGERKWDLKSITKVRWGGTRHSINGIPTGTTYKIVFGNGSDYSYIDLRREEVYNNFVERMWKAVCARLLTGYLEGLRAGKEYVFGSARVNDRGMELERRQIFSGKQRVFCAWDEMVIWNGPGVFCVGKKNDKKLMASFSYQDEDNIHILEAGIRTLWKRGGDRLSSILEE